MKKVYVQPEISVAECSAKDILNNSPNFGDNEIPWEDGNLF